MGCCGRLRTSDCGRINRQRTCADDFLGATPSIFCGIVNRPKVIAGPIFASNSTVRKTIDPVHEHQSLGDDLRLGGRQSRIFDWGLRRRGGTVDPVVSDQASDGTAPFASQRSTTLDPAPWQPRSTAVVRGCLHLPPGSPSCLGPFAKPGGNRNLPNMEVCRDLETLSVRSARNRIRRTRRCSDR